LSIKSISPVAQFTLSLIAYWPAVMVLLWKFELLPMLPELNRLISTLMHRFVRPGVLNSK
jgi:hypothetical protein